MALDFPLDFRRQYEGPLDADSVFATTAERLAYLSNPTRYAGQMVYDQELNQTFWVNSAKDGFSTTPNGDLDKINDYIGKFASQAALDLYIINKGVTVEDGDFAVLKDTKAFVIYDLAQDTWNPIAGGGGDTGDKIVFSELDTASPPILMEGPQNNFTVVAPDEVTSYSFQAKLDTQTEYSSTLADETALEAWINSNVATDTTLWKLIMHVVLSEDVELTVILRYE